MLGLDECALADAGGADGFICVFVCWFDCVGAVVAVCHGLVADWLRGLRVFVATLYMLGDTGVKVLFFLVFVIIPQPSLIVLEV